MDIQAAFDSLFAGWQAEREGNEEHWSLGQLTEELEKLPTDSRVLMQYDDQLVGFGELDSYRGYYSDLCLEIDGTEPVKVSELLALLQAANGETFTGYKGGDYTMSEHTVLWVDYYGSCGNYAVCDLTKLHIGSPSTSPVYVIHTRKTEY